MLLCTLFFFFNDTATTEIYTLSLHDALPISPLDKGLPVVPLFWIIVLLRCMEALKMAAAPPRRLFSMVVLNPAGPLTSMLDRKSTRLNSSHLVISYAVFCLKKKNTHICRAWS